MAKEKTEQETGNEMSQENGTCNFGKFPCLGPSNRLQLGRDLE